MFTDMVRSTEIAAELGDSRWRELLRRHHTMLRQQLKTFGGREIDMAGDGLFAIFDVPAQAVRCACAMVEASQELGVEIRAGLHVGEVEVAGREIRGIAVHTGSRLCSLAGPTDVLVTSTLTELVGGSQIEFEDRGIHTFKGVPGDWRVSNVARIGEAPRVGPLEPGVAHDRLATIEAPTFVRRNKRWLVAGSIGVAAAASALMIVTLRHPPPKPQPIAPLDSVVRIDAKTGALIRQGAKDLPLEQSYDVNIATGEGAVWLLAGSGGPDLFQLDAVSGEVRNSIPQVLGFGIGRGVIWIDSGSPLSGPGPRRPTLASIDPSTGTELTSSGVGHLLSASPQAVWVTVQGGVTEVDPKTGRPLKTFRVPGQAADGEAMRDAFWVADNTADTLTRIELSSGTQMTLPLAATPDRIVVGGGYVWALDRAGGTVTVIDANTAQQVASIRVSAHPTDLTYGGGAIWVSDGVDGTITRIDVATRQLSSLHVGVPIRALTVDRSSGDLWIAIAPGRQSS